MKKSIKAELISLAHKILQLKDNASYNDIAINARELHEKLTILSYAEKLEQSGMPTIGLHTIEQSMRKEIDDLLPKQKIDPINSPVPPPEKTSAQILAKNQALFSEPSEVEDDQYRPDGTQFNEDPPVHEPVIEKIKDMWPEMSPAAADIDKVIESIIPKEPEPAKSDSFEIENEYGKMPVFEPKDATLDDKPKNLNDKLKGGSLKIGLNDKLSFIKNLFNGSAQDYNRVLSQLETLSSSDEAIQFINQMIKPDYNNWEGKETQEERFMEIVLGKYN